MLPVELLATLSVDNVSIATLNQPAEPVHSSAFLVDVEALLGLKQLWDGAPTLPIILEVDITHQLMWVKVELFEAEGRWHLALFVDFGSVKELLLGVVLKNVASEGVCQVTTYIGKLSSLVNMVALTVIKHDNIATVVTVELTQDIMHVKVPLLSIRGNLNRMVLLLEVLDRVLVHLDSGL